MVWTPPMLSASLFYLPWIFLKSFWKYNTKSVGITNTLKNIFDLIFWTTYKFKKTSTSTIPGLRETSVNPYAVDTLSVVTKRQILRKLDTFGRRNVLFKYTNITFEQTDFAKSNNAYNRLLMDDVLSSIMNNYSIFTQQMNSEAIRTGIKDKKKPPSHIVKQWKLSISADSLLRTENIQLILELQCYLLSVFSIERNNL